MNGLGRSVMAGALSGEESTLDISSLTTGVYFTRVASDAGVSVERFVKR